MIRLGRIVVATASEAGVCYHNRVMAALQERAMRYREEVRESAFARDYLDHCQDVARDLGGRMHYHEGVPVLVFPDVPVSARMLDGWTKQ